MSVVYFRTGFLGCLFFTIHKEKPICLICSETVSVKKEYNLKRHYESKHSSIENMNGELRKEKIQHLKKALACQQIVYQNVQNKADNIVGASFLITEKIAKHFKPYSDGEFVKECLSAVVNILCPEKRMECDNICLSRWTVTRRIDDMADISLAGQ